MRTAIDIRSSLLCRRLCRPLALCAALLLSAPLALSGQEERIVPVPALLTDFQVGTLIGLHVDYDKGSGDWRHFYDHGSLFVDYQYRFFSLGFSFGFTDQEQFDAEGNATAPTDYYLGHWFVLHEGILAFNFDRFFISLGWSRHRDAIDSPYALFISSRPHPALNAEFAYDGDVFFMNTRWVGLSLNSGLRVPDAAAEGGTALLADRGLNFRTFGFKFGDGWSIGYQESVVYLNTYFDPLYFLVPIPYQFTQLVLSTPGSPFYTAPDPNTLLGLFVRYDSAPHYAYVQGLLDDFQLTAAGKIAWSAGYRLTTAAGRFALYHAGATKFTYQSTRPATNYPYLYYATNSYPTRSGDKTVWYFDNYIGYLYGENTLSFRFEYDHRFGPTDFRSGLEYVISGDKAPTNPWHGAAAPPGTTLFLDGNRLEHTIIADIATVTDLYEDVDLLLDVSIGYVFNELAPTEPPPDDNVSGLPFALFTPSTESRLLFHLFVGVQYVYNQHPVSWRTERGLPQQRR